MKTAQWTLAEFADVLDSSPETALANSRTRESIQNLTQDSRRINGRSIFFVIQGAKATGAHYLDEACQKGPLALILPPSLVLTDAQKRWIHQFGSAVFRSQDVKASFAKILSEFWLNPTEKLFVVGITGTNGKTTTTHLAESLLNSVGCGTAVMGTINHHYQQHTFETHLTTPGPEELFERMALFVSLGAKAVVMEVSSHALDQQRTASVEFNLAAFTNFTRDHLDYHKDMQTYFKAKELLFTRELKRSQKTTVGAILNSNHEEVIKTHVDPRAELIYAGQNPPKQSHRVRYEILQADLNGFRLNFYIGREDPLTCHLPLVGSFNVENAVVAVAALDFYLRHLDPNDRVQRIQSALEDVSHFPGVRGRLERVAKSSPYFLFVDYAHTDDALKNVLQTLRHHQTNSQRLHVVFGCGGDRDPGKRPLMAAVACAFADQIVITSDNPRTEDPVQIIADIEKGIPFDKRRHVHVQPDRRAAIRFAIAQLALGDILLVAGKGHETYQVLGRATVHFDDREEIEEGLKLYAQKN